MVHDDSPVQAGFIQEVHMGKASRLAGDLISVQAHFGHIAVREQPLHLFIPSLKGQIPHIRHMIPSNLITWQPDRLSPT